MDNQRNPRWDERVPEYRDLNLRPGERVMGEVKTGPDVTITIVRKPPNGPHPFGLYILQAWRWYGGKRFSVSPGIWLPRRSLSHIVDVLQHAMALDPDGDQRPLASAAGADPGPWGTPSDGDSP